MARQSTIERMAKDAGCTPVELLMDMYQKHRNQRGVARALAVDPSNVSRAVKRLGLVEVTILEVAS